MLDDDFELNINFGEPSTTETLPSPPKPSLKPINIHENRPEKNIKQKSINIINNNKRDSKPPHSDVKKTEKKPEKVKKIQSQSIEPPVVPKPANEKYHTLTIEEDPMQFHAKPRDLSKNALKRPAMSVGSSHIFTRTAFSSFNLDKRLVSHLESPREKGGMGLLSSTRVQSVVIPTLEEKQNILMKSETGSGKTLAYLIPVINDLMTMSPAVSRADGTYAVVLAPTRELCAQIADVLELLTKCCVWIVGGSITGGEKRKSEKARLRKGISVLIGTPGRFLDHVRATESFNLNHLRWFVLDEADRLLDMGFEQTILEICSVIIGTQLPGLKVAEGTAPSEARNNLQHKWQQQSLHQSKVCTDISKLSFLMASATLTKAVKHLAMPVMGGRGFLVVDAERQSVEPVNDLTDLLALGKDTGRLDGGTGAVQGVVEEEVGPKKKRGGLDEGEMMEAPEQLAQYFMMVTCKWRLAALLSFLRLHSHEKVMVFFATCDSVDYHALLMHNTEWPLELDAPIADSSSGDSTGGTPKTKTDTSDHYLDPLEYTFTGIFGKECNMYRLHGNVPQRSRQQVYKKFCNASKGVLLCTDVAARGLDLPSVDWIVQYDPPCETTDYVHRIGRTARRGQGGSAVIFLLPSEAQYLQLLQSHGMAPRPLSLQNLFLESSSQIPGSGKFKNVDEMTAVILQRRVESTVLKNRYLLDAARQSFRSFVRAYATHSSDAKGIFKVQSLHLGHVAKCFGLRESPSALRNHDDVIGKIFNGAFSKEVIASEKTKKRNRDEVYSLSAKSKRSRGAVDKKNDDSSKKPVAQLPKNERQKIRKIGLSASGSFRKTNGYFKKKLRTTAVSEFKS